MHIRVQGSLWDCRLECVLIGLIIIPLLCIGSGSSVRSVTPEPTITSEAPSVTPSASTLRRFAGFETIELGKTRWSQLQVELADKGYVISEPYSSRISGIQAYSVSISDFRPQIQKPY